MKRIILALPLAMFLTVAAAVALSCGTEPASSDPAGGAHVMENGVRWLRVKAGTGRIRATAGGLADPAVSWTDVPCSDECEHVYNGHRDTKIYDPFRGNLLEMRVGEVRRLWIPRTDKDGFWTADVQLYEVYDTGSDGGPVIPPLSRVRFPAQSDGHSQKTTSVQ